MTSRGRCLLGAVLLAGGIASCAEPRTADLTSAGVCVHAGAGFEPGVPIDLEIRLDDEVVATGTTTVGQAYVAEVPTGEIEVYADGRHYGGGRVDGPQAVDEDGRPLGGFYLGGEGCPPAP